MPPAQPSESGDTIAIPPPPLPLAETLASANETKELRLGQGVLDQVVELFRAQFPREMALVVADDTTFALAGETVQKSLQTAGLASSPAFVFHESGLYAEYSFMEKLEAEFRRQEVIPIAIGSGTINDLVKLAAHRVGRPYCCVATAASMDGYTAFGASITYQGAKQTFNCPAPSAVIADIDLIHKAPSSMTASGYADLQAKIPAGADWILADALGIEPIESRSWAIVQGGLREALADPKGAREGDPAAITALTEGLILSGFAMQWVKTSRPASGAEHQFSHLWDMEHHKHNGIAPSHGFKVGLATLAIASLYEEVLKLPLDKLDIDRCCARWPNWDIVEADIRSRFAGDEFVETAVKETAAKHPTASNLRLELERLVSVWPELREKLRAQLLPTKELRHRLHTVGAPTTPEAIGLTRERLRRSFERAYFIRRRFTVLDLVVRTGTLDDSLDTLFDQGGVWSNL